MTGLRAVTFDFWGTLMRDRPDGLARARAVRLAALAAGLSRAGQACPPQSLERAYDRCEAVMDGRFWQHRRDVPVCQQVCLLLECLEAGLAARLPDRVLADAVDGYAAAILAAPPDLLPGAGEAVRRLRAAGLRLAIVSNTGRTPGRTLRRLLAGQGLLEHFAVISYSDEVGVRKPHPEIFTRTLERLGVEAGQALHVGDNPEDDVRGARGVGMRAAHYAGHAGAPAAEADLVVNDLGDLPARLGL